MGLLITGLGYTSGLFLEGSKLQILRIEFLPTITENQTASILIVATIVFSFADIRRVSASLTYALVGSIIGIALALGVNLDLSYLTKIALLWLVGPVVVLVLSTGLARLVSRRDGNSWRQVQIYRIGLVLAAFFTAYALGANTLGAILSMIPSSGPINLFVVASGSVVGAFVLGRGPISRLGREIYALGYSSAFLSQTIGAAMIELSTQAGIPLSASRIVTSSTIGVGLSRPVRILNPRTVYVFFAEWFSVPMAAFVVSFLLERFLHV